MRLNILHRPSFCALVAIVRWSTWRFSLGSSNVSRRGFKTLYRKLAGARNPRRIFEDSALKELAESIRTQGVLSPLLVRPLTESGFEIVAGARRYRAPQMAEAVPVRIVNLNDAEALKPNSSRT